MVEFEKKVLISPQEYEMLIQQRYPCGTAYLQTNYYYDTADFKLNKTGITCRIRERDGVRKATVKDHQQKQKECSVENLISCKEEPELFFKRMGLDCQGSLKTERIVYPICPGIEVVMDKNTYLDCVDYELEVEYDFRYEATAYMEMKAIEAFILSNEGKMAASEFRKRIGKGGSKSERFFERKSYLKKTLGRKRAFFELALGKE